MVYLGVAVAGCGSKPDGKYSDPSGTMSIEFKSGKAIVSTMGNPETCDYTMDGDKITVKSASGQALVFTLMKDGTIQGGGETFTKNK
jgi:hypothetical protein